MANSIAGTTALATLLLTVACGSGQGPSSALPEQDGVPKAYLAGDQWQYTRTYSVVGASSRLSELRGVASIVLQENVLIVELVGDEWNGGDRSAPLAAGWPVLGHTRAGPCNPEVETNTIDEECPPWYEKTHFIPDFARPLVHPSKVDRRIGDDDDSERREPSEMVVEDGYLVIAQDHDVYDASDPTNRFVVTVRHALERLGE